MPEHNSPGPSKPESGNRPLLGLSRVKAFGTHGLAASAMGWVLVGCIAFGFGVGTLLDRRFGTQFWMPIMVLLGVAAGFREMFRTLAAVNRENEQKKKQRVASRQNTTQQSTLKSATPSQNVAEASPRSRLFDTPPPPVPSFEGGAVHAEQPGEHVPDEEVEVEDVLRAFLEKDNPQESEKQDSDQNEDETSAGFRGAA